jgi:hypothetical protein
MEKKLLNPRENHPSQLGRSVKMLLEMFPGSKIEAFAGECGVIVYLL